MRISLPAVLVASAALTLLAAPSAFATDLTVDQAAGTDAGACASACKTVAYAISKSQAGDRIVVKPGVYHEQVTVGPSRTLIGAAGLARPTIDGGAGTGVTVQGTEAVVQGLRLRGDTHGLNVSTLSGGAVVQDDVFDDAAVNDTGKLAASSAATISGNLFQAQSALASSSAGIVANTQKSVDVVGNTFEDFYVAVTLNSVPASPHKVRDNVISGVHDDPPYLGSGISSTGSVVIDDNVIGGGAGSGGAVGMRLADFSVPATIVTHRNRVFGFNASGISGGFLVAGTTFASVGDLAMGNGTGIQLYGGNPTITASTAYDNANYDVYLGGNTALTMRSSIVGAKGISAALGATCAITASRGPKPVGQSSSCKQFTTNDDPGFVGPGDYHLTAGSPLLDRGDPNASADVTDIDGHPRALVGLAAGRCSAPLPDMGAYEFAPSPALVCPAVKQDPPIDPGAPNDPGTPNHHGTPQDPGTPQTPEVPQVPRTPAPTPTPPAHGAITVLDDATAAVTTSVDGGKGRKVAAHGVGSAQTIAPGAHTIRVTGPGNGKKAKVATVRFRLAQGQLGVVVVTMSRGTPKVKVTRIARSTRHIMSLLPGAPPVKLGAAKAKKLAHGRFAAVPLAATSVTVGTQRKIALKPWAQLTVLVAKSHRATAVGRGA